MAILKGRYEWIEYPIFNTNRTTIEQSINFTHDGKSFTKIRLYWHNEIDIQYVDGSEQERQIYNDDEGMWFTDDRSIDFGSSGQSVSDEFYNQFIPNVKELPMADQTKNYVIQQKQEDGMLTLHPETDAAIVKYDGSSSGLTANNAQSAIDELKTLVNDFTDGGVVTGVKGAKESTFRQGDVSISPSDIGAVAENPAITGATHTKITYDSKGLITAGADLTASDIPDLSAKYIPASQKGASSGVATLDTGGKVPASQLPSYVDDVLEFDNKASFPATGESGKIYISKNDNKTYRWSGTAYVEISASLALGETAATAYAGNKGKQNADNIAAIIAGTQPVGKATEADHAASADSASEATHAASAETASSATNATTAATAAKLATPRAISLANDVTGSANFDGSANVSISAALKNVGTPGTYSVVTTDAKGRVTAGGQIVEVGSAGQTTPSAALAVGGLFFKEV